jgi:DNA-directed RNA polymerase subunit RPC12/RpoP
MVNYKTVYKCHACGTPSYKRLMERQPSGAWLPTGAYQCAGCRNVFETLRAWWGEAPRAPDFQSSRMPA